MITFVFTSGAGGNVANDWNGVLKVLDNTNKIISETFNWSTYTNYPNLPANPIGPPWYLPPAQYTGPVLFASDPLSTIADDVVIGPSGGNLSYQVVINGLDMFGKADAADSLSIATGSSLTINQTAGLGLTNTPNGNTIQPALTLGAGIGSAGIGNLGYALVNNGGVTINTSLFSVGGNISNSGVIRIHNNQNLGGSWLQLTTDVTLSGNGSIILDDALNSLVEITGWSTVIAPTLHNVNNTISGGGTIGSVAGVSTYKDPGFRMNLDNQASGIVNATSSASALTINGGSVKNAGLLEATGGAPQAASNGLLIVNTTVVQSGAGAIWALGAGSNVRLSNVTIQGGLLNTTNGGVITNDNTSTGSFTGSSTVLDGGSAAGAITIGSFAVGGQTDFTLKGSIINIGTISMTTGGIGDVLKIGAGDVTLSGGGQIVMTTPAGSGLLSNAITGWSTTIASTLHNVNNVISGVGTIGLGGTYQNLQYLLVLDNQVGGTISANNSGVALALNTGSAITNNGWLIAAGGTLSVMDSVVGTGSAMINSGGTMTFAKSFQENLLFLGNGTLNLSQIDLGTISGFAAGDAINFSYINSNQPLHAIWEAGNSLLAIVDSANTLFTGIHLAGKYSTGEFVLAQSGSGTSITLKAGAVPSSDFNGDGIADFLMSNGNTLVDGEYKNGATAYTTVGGFGPEWQLVGSGDFLNDGGHAGLLHSSGSGGIVVDEIVNGQQSLTNIGGIGNEWKFIGSGNFDGAGGDDFLIRNTLGSLDVGTVVNGKLAYTQIGSLGSEWSFGGQNGLSADFLADGHTDFLMHSSGSGAVVVGEDINGTAAYHTIAFAGNEWSYLAAGDFFGDGHQDFLMRNTSGSLAVGEYKNGSTTFSAIGGVGSEWQFIGSGDFLGDGKTGVLMHSTGSGATYEMEVTNGQANYTRLTGWGNEWHAQT